MLLLGLNGVLIEVRIIWYQSLGSKIRFIIILPFVSCHQPILFLLSSLFLVFVFVLCTKLKSCTRFRRGKKKKKKNIKKKKKKRETSQKKKKKKNEKKFTF
jgi:phosphotransferase system  glucose/maltose/N-acetylglucosamine-specific IIC component